jgi:hypothetical protein
MSAFKAWTISAGLALVATAANAQGLPPQNIARSGYTAASDISGPYADVPPPPRVIYGAPAYGPRPAPGPAYGYDEGAVSDLMPPREVYAVLRQSGFSPLGVPRLRGMVYVISALDREGEDGRLTIDARSGRILRFVPAYELGDNIDGRFAPPPGYGPPPRPMNRIEGRLDAPALLPTSHVAGTPVAGTKLATRMPPSSSVPKAGPSKPAVINQPVAAKPAPAPVQQSAAAPIKPADAPAAAPAASAPPVVEAKPEAPAIQATQPMPKVQDLE